MKMVILRQGRIVVGWARGGVKGGRGRRRRRRRRRQMRMRMMMSIYLGLARDML